MGLQRRSPNRWRLHIWLWDDRTRWNQTSVEMKAPASQRRGGVNVSVPPVPTGLTSVSALPNSKIRASGAPSSRRRWKRQHLRALVQAYLWRPAEFISDSSAARGQIEWAQPGFPHLPSESKRIVVPPPTLLLSNLCLLLNIQIFSAITLFSKHSGDLGEMIKAEMIAMLCFCLACFLDMADMLITVGLAVTALTAAETSASPERNTFVCRSLLFALSFWVRVHVQTLYIRPSGHVSKRSHSVRCL